MALIFLIGGVLGLALITREYRHGRDRTRGLYSRVVDKKDVLELTDHAFFVLADTELRAQDYVLTGETVYFKAYADDLRQWQEPWYPPVDNPSGHCSGSGQGIFEGSNPHAR
jgi:hypothetical protein